MEKNTMTTKQVNWTTVGATGKTIAISALIALVAGAASIGGQYLAEKIIQRREETPEERAYRKALKQQKKEDRKKLNKRAKKEPDEVQNIISNLEEKIK